MKWTKSSKSTNNWNDIGNLNNPVPAKENKFVINKNYEKNHPGPDGFTKEFSQTMKELRQIL